MKRIALSFRWITLFFALAAAFASLRAQAQKHNVIIFVADGLRRGSVNPTDMPTLSMVRKAGVDFANSHSVYPTITTVNASTIATGHGVGDTGDFANSVYPGLWLSKPDVTAPDGTIVPFLESDDILANLNSAYKGDYIGEKPLLSVAREQGFNVASIGKIGPTAIQQIDQVSWDDQGNISGNDAIIVDDSTGQSLGIRLPQDVIDGIAKTGLPPEAPARTNGFGLTSQWNNGFHGDAELAGTLDANRIQEQWFVDVTTKVVLPKFAAEKKPFVLLFWSRDPDGTQHDEGDSLQHLEPGINGDTSKRGLQNADHCLKQLLDWLDAHPAIKANTDVLITSDHGFATISRREIAADGTATAEVSAALSYAPNGTDKAEPQGTLPQGFLAIDLAVRQHMRLFDAQVRSTTGSSAYQELTLNGEKAHYPGVESIGALLGDTAAKVDGSDAQIILEGNAGTDLLYIPSKNMDLVRQTVATIAQFDYVGGIFVDDTYCPTATDCPGALPMSAVGMVGKAQLPRPAIVVSFKNFYATPGDLQSSKQIADTHLQEGQGNHGALARDQTFNNMAAIGPDFKAGFVDDAPMGNIDITPTIAHILGIDMPSVGTLKGRVLTEALAGGAPVKRDVEKTMVSAPFKDGIRTVLEYQELNGVRYYDRACLLTKAAEKSCP